MLEIRSPSATMVAEFQGPDIANDFIRGTDALPSSHEDLLNLSQRRVLIEPLALRSVYTPQCALDVSV